MCSNINPRDAHNRTPDPGPLPETGAIRRVMDPRRPVLHTEDEASDSWTSTASTTAWSTDCPDKENSIVPNLVMHETPQSSRQRGARRPSPERRRPLSNRTPLQDYSQGVQSDSQPRTPLGTRVYEPTRVVRSPDTPHTTYDDSRLPFKIIAVPIYGCQNPMQHAALYTPAGRNEFRAWSRKLQEDRPSVYEMPFSPDEYVPPLENWFWTPGYVIADLLRKERELRECQNQFDEEPSSKIPNTEAYAEPILNEGCVGNCPFEECTDENDSPCYQSSDNPVRQNQAASCSFAVYTDCPTRHACSQENSFYVYYDSPPLQEPVQRSHFKIYFDSPNMPEHLASRPEKIYDSPSNEAFSFQIYMDSPSKSKHRSHSPLKVCQDSLRRDNFQHSSLKVCTYIPVSPIWQENTCHIPQSVLKDRTPRQGPPQRAPFQIFTDSPVKRETTHNMLMHNYKHSPELSGYNRHVSVEHDQENTSMVPPLRNEPYQRSNFVFPRDIDDGPIKERAALPLTRRLSPVAEEPEIFQDNEATYKPRASCGFSPSQLAQICCNIERDDRRDRMMFYAHLRDMQDRRKYYIFNVLGIDPSHEIPEVYDGDFAVIDDVSVDLVDSSLNTVNGDHDTSRSAYHIEARNDGDVSPACLTPPHNGGADIRQAVQDAPNYLYEGEVLLREWPENGNCFIASPLSNEKAMGVIVGPDPEANRLYRLIKLD